MKIVALQFDIAWENKPANFAKVRSLLKAAAPAPGSLVALPEMFATGFSMNADAIAEKRGGETEQFLQALAREFQCVILGGLAFRELDGTIRNSALAVSAGGDVLCAYHKMRPFSPGEEDRHYIAGTQPVVFDWNGCTVAPFICYDLRFPELFRAVARTNQPELFIVIASFPAKRSAHWMRLLQARAIENQAYVMGVNRVGNDPHYRYNGHSLIIDPQGDIITDAGEAETVIQGEVDLENLKKYRAGLPFLKDIRPIE